MKRKNVNILMAMLGASILTAGSASANGKSWNDQLYPYDFIFGNHIDTHQQTGVTNAQICQLDVF